MQEQTSPLPQARGLTPEQVASYHRDGYLILPALFTAAEAKAFQAESDRLYSGPFVDPKNLRTPTRVVGSDPNGERKMEKIDPVIDVSPCFYNVVHDERIGTPLRQIFEEPALLFKDKLIFKYPEMAGYSMHQDYAWWQPQGEESELPGMHPDKILSVMIAVDAADAENGAIELFPGYHHSLISTPGELRNMKADEIEQIDLCSGILGTTQPGDVIIFHSLAPHRSGCNLSTRSRRQLYMTYNAASAGDAYASQQVHYKAYASRGINKDGLFFL